MIDVEEELIYKEVEVYSKGFIQMWLISLVTLLPILAFIYVVLQVKIPMMLPIAFGKVVVTIVIAIVLGKVYKKVMERVGYMRKKSTKKLLLLGGIIFKVMTLYYFLAFLNVMGKVNVLTINGAITYINELKTLIVDPLNLVDGLTTYLTYGGWGVERWLGVANFFIVPIVIILAWIGEYLIFFKVTMRTLGRRKGGPYSSSKNRYYKNKEFYVKKFNERGAYTNDGALKNIREFIDEIKKGEYSWLDTLEIKRSEEDYDITGSNYYNFYGIETYRLKGEENCYLRVVGYKVEYRSRKRKLDRTLILSKYLKIDGELIDLIEEKAR